MKGSLFAVAVLLFALSGEAVADPSKEFTILPGVGYEPLTGSLSLQLFNFTYNDGKTTPDKAAYLIPDQVTARRVLYQTVDFSSKIVKSFDEYQSGEDIGVNAGGAYDGVTGSFGADHQDAKTRITKQGSAMATTSANVHLYDLTVDATTPLAEGPKLIISSAICSLQYGSKREASLLLSQLIGDYGSAYLKSVELGYQAKITDFVSSSYAMSKDSKAMSQNAQVSFFGVFSIGDNYKTSEVDTSEYQSSIEQSRAVAKGCGLWTPGTSYENWTKSCDGGEALLGGEAFPIYNLINPIQFPGANVSIVNEAHNLAVDLVQKLVEINSYHGCTDPTSPAFKLRYNIADPGACKANAGLMSFGGFYVSCSGSSAFRVDDDDFFFHHHHYESNYCEGTNAMTGAQNCPEGYDDNVVYTDDVRELHICTANGTDLGSNFIFGGMYSDNQANMAIGGKGCSTGFESYPVDDSNTVHGFSGLTFCLAQPNQIAEQTQLLFGGMYSCNHGNPLAMDDKGSLSKSKRCPKGFDAVLADQSPGGQACPIWYCTQARDDGKFPAFTKYPVKSTQMPLYGVCSASDIEHARDEEEELNETLEDSPLMLGTAARASKGLSHRYSHNLPGVQDSNAQRLGSALSMRVRQQRQQQLSPQSQQHSETPSGFVEEEMATGEAVSPSGAAPSTSGVSAGAVAGIAIACVVFGAVLAAVGFVWAKRTAERRRRPRVYNQKERRPSQEHRASMDMLARDPEANVETESQRAAAEGYSVLRSP